MSRRESREPSRSSGNHNACSAEELTANNVRAVAALEAEARRNRSTADRIADAVARFCGSMTFFWTHVAGFAAWIGINSIPSLSHFDPFPFTFLTLVVSLEAIFLSTFIMVSQNQEKRLAERCSHLDLQINLLAEQETTKILNVLAGIAKKVGAASALDAETAALEQATRPDQLARQIDHAIESTADPKDGRSRKPDGKAARRS
jgi:uncharacterized membrane protein